jgi:type VI secretion system secreted protein VgrG
MATNSERRAVSVRCVLGDDVLLLRRMRGQESLSALSEYVLELYSERADLQVDALLATTIGVRVDLPRGGLREFNGYITRCALTGRQGRYSTYQVTVRPWLWFLTRSPRSRAFRALGVLDIVEAILSPYACADIDCSSLRARYPPLPDCVQEHESDFDFLSRLLERAGIHYFFRSAADRHTMVLADCVDCHLPAPGYGSLCYLPVAGAATYSSEVVYQWHMSAELAASACGQFEPRHAIQRQAQAATRARGVSAGALFKLTGHPHVDRRRDHLIVHAAFVLAPVSHTPMAEERTEAELDCTFSVVDPHDYYGPPAPTRTSQGGR